MAQSLLSHDLSISIHDLLLTGNFINASNYDFIFPKMTMKREAMMMKREVILLKWEASAHEEKENSGFHPTSMMEN